MLSLEKLSVKKSSQDISKRMSHVLASALSYKINSNNDVITDNTVELITSGNSVCVKHINNGYLYETDVSNTLEEFSLDEDMFSSEFYKIWKIKVVQSRNLHKLKKWANLELVTNEINPCGTIQELEDVLTKNRDKLAFFHLSELYQEGR